MSGKIILNEMIADMIASTPGGRVTLTIALFILIYGVYKINTIIIEKKETKAALLRKQQLERQGIANRTFLKEYYEGGRHNGKN